MLFHDNTAIKIRRSKEEFEELKNKADLKAILNFLDSMKIKMGVLNNLERWEREFLRERAKELEIKGMSDFLNFRDYKWIKFRDYVAAKRESRAETKGRGLIPGSVALPPAQNIGGFVYRENSKRKKRNHSGKIDDTRKDKEFY